MRKITKPETLYPGATKIVKKFAFLPITIGKETRWLESVTICYTWDYHEFSDLPYWKPLHFINK